MDRARALESCRCCSARRTRDPPERELLMLFGNRRGCAAVRAAVLSSSPSSIIEMLEDRRLLSTNYDLIDTIKAPTPQEFQNFGVAMAANASGTHVLVGAQGT